MAGMAQDVIYAALIVSDCDECGFNDLGKLLFGGVLAAIIVGVAVSISLRRAKKSRADESQFVSIRHGTWLTALYVLWISRRRGGSKTAVAGKF